MKRRQIECVAISYHHLEVVLDRIPVSIATPFSFFSPVSASLGNVGRPTFTLIAKASSRDYEHSSGVEF